MLVASEILVLILFLLVVLFSRVVGTSRNDVDPDRSMLS